MGKQLRLLIVEDSEDDAILIVQELRRGGYDVTFLRVDSPESMTGALENQSWDLILSDHRMPHFDSLAALEIAQHQDSNLPFIIVSGTIGEEEAVGAMRAGAHDYLMKNNLVRLIPAVARELLEAEDRRARYLAEEALRKSEERSQLSIEKMPFAFIIWDTEWRVIEWNNEAENIFGYTKAEVEGKSILDYIVPQEARPMVAELMSDLRDGQSVDFSEPNNNIRKDGKLISCKWRNTPLRNDNGDIFAVLSMAEDITEHKRAEEALRYSQAKLVALSRQLVTAQETERYNIARELHDEIGQEITAVSILLGKLQDSNADRALGEDLHQLVDMVNRALENIRNLSHELHPTILDDLGLVPALRWLFKRQAKIGGFRATIDDTSLSTPLAPNLKIVCFRILQEALTNIMKYAQATMVEVTLLETGAELHITIQDDGIGFDVDSAMEKATSGESMGLLSMEERASSIGGKLVITSELSRGTLIAGQFPLDGIVENERRVSSDNVV